METVVGWDNTASFELQVPTATFIQSHNEACLVLYDRTSLHKLKRDREDGDIAYSTLALHLSSRQDDIQEKRYQYFTN